eukprot:5507309-Pleurochrysis_carterae.AAC.1
MMRSAHNAKSGAEGEVSASSAARSADAADAAYRSADAAETASASCRWRRADRKAAGTVPKEKAAASVAELKSGSMDVGRTRASTLIAARVAAVKVEVPDKAANVHHKKAAPRFRAFALCAGVRTTCSSGTMTGTGATARRGPPAYSPARKQARSLTVQIERSHRCATLRAAERG